jgi:protease-4
MDSDYGSYTPAERERVRALMNDFYQDFISKVADARMKSVEEVDQIAQGRVWTGEQAHGNGLVDELGGLDAALRLLKEKAGISAEAQVELVEYPRAKSLIEMVLERLEQENVRAALDVWRGQVFPWEHIERVFPSPVWARMPYAVEFR